ncbi:hypothetical protein FA13DRAFT_1820597 [Coprinellus micaceus]|uniref:F-box domain-containing protein n=1 Tax=Coprinellus micaceus TaxID=71717 RepID=A0A4Y7SDR5_COPMI|nr:hypothetical protein FA13DRAFT_1820597 [Coprinellus micaceus]
MESLNSGDVPAVADLGLVRRKAKSASVPLASDEASSMVRASQLVGTSHDILPKILGDLKDLIASESATWKGKFSQLLIVNRPFFHHGADVLWDTMDSLEPAFKLLPWFSTPYTGIENHRYSGAADWERFITYSSRIKSYVLSSPPNLHMDPPWFMELFTLPDRPDPMFPALQRIHVSSSALTGPPLLFLLIGPALRSLHLVLIKSSIAQDNALSILPRLTTSTPHLQTFQYQGVFRPKLFLHVSKFASIISLDLGFLDGGDPRYLRDLRRLPHLERLTIHAPTFDVKSGREILLKPSLQSRSGLQTLRHQSITASGYQQCLIATVLSPRKLHSVVLEIGNATDAMAFHLCIGLYLSGNPSLRELVVSFKQVDRTPAPPSQSSTNRNDWPSAQVASGCFTHSLEASRHVQMLTITDMPPHIAILSYPNLIYATNSWELLCTLHIQVALPAGAELQDAETRLFARLFPGLSFLASNVWKHFPNMENLELHFDGGLIAEEDIYNQTHPRALNLTMILTLSLIS